MIISNPGKIIDNLYMIGPMGLPVYLLTGEEPVLFDAGVAFLGPIYVEAVRRLITTQDPAYCFLTHSHFDHCGSISILKRHFPGMSVIASEGARKVFSRPNAIDLIAKLNQAAADDAQAFDAPPHRFESFKVDQTVREGDCIAAGPDMTIQVFETPGHTRDCLSYYIPEKKILIASEALGIADQTGYIFSDFLVDYDLYLSSIEKLSCLDVTILCLGHYYVYTGADARHFFHDAKKCCEAFLNRVEKLVHAENGDMNRIIECIKQEEYDGKPWPKQPEAAYLLNLESRIKVVQKRMGLKDGV